MGVLVCRKCSTRFTIGARMCPQCCGEDAYIDADQATIQEEGTMPRNTVAGASLGVLHPDYVEGGPVPPIVPVGDALDAPISEQLGEVEEAAQVADEPVDEPQVTDPLPDEPVTVDDKPAPKKTTRR